MALRSNAHVALQSIFQVPRYAGVFPYNDQYKVTQYHLSWSLFSIIVSTGLSSFGMLYPGSIDGVYNVQVRRLVKLLSMNLSNIYAVVHIMLSGNNVVLIRDKLLEVEKGINAQGGKWFWRQSNFRMYFYTSVVIAKLMLHCLIVYFEIGLLPALSIATFIPIMVMLFETISVLVGLMNMVCSLYDKILIVPSTECMLKFQEKLIIIGEMCNETFKIQVLLFSMNVFIFSVLSFYFELIKAILDYELIIQVSWIVIFVLPFIDLVFCCRKIIQKVPK